MILKKMAIAIVWWLFFLFPFYYAVAQASIPAYKTVAPRPLYVTAHKTTILIFPAEIKGVDRGSNQLLSKMVSGVSNILKVKAANDSIGETNLNVFTANGFVYTFNVTYLADLPIQTFDFTQEPKYLSSQPLALFPGSRLNDDDVKQYAKAIVSYESFLRRPSSSEIYGMKLRLSGMFIHEGVLFFQFRLNNASTIPYDVDFIRFYVRDRKKGKRTAIMEKEIYPLYEYNSDGNKLAPNSSLTLAIAFDKFTIADDKNLCVEMFEHNGDRHLSLKLKGKHILKAKTLLPPVLP